MKIFFLFLLLISLVSCNIHFIRKPKPQSMLALPADKGLKVALIGFYPYQYSSYSSGRRTTTTAVLDYKNRIQASSKIGKPAEFFPTSGIDTSVPPEKVKEFVMNYLNEVKRSGFDEITKVVEIQKEGEESKMYLKKRDVDYYVVGVHGPAFPKDFDPRFLLTAHLFMLTLGTFPFWQVQEADSKFYIYDHGLNLINTRVFRNKYEVIAGWWGEKEQGAFNRNPEAGFMPRLYEPDVIDFSAEFPTLIQKP
ncbi:hypothetical protein LPTSP3_g08010 [Leptospira kobayashii]|uniref:Lipoprotein n=2 Tax=Leptospira kobayashii TaxID=1917830 RepID=A0ABN6KDY3_9LEPT|nr:hypothetical protein LPTSP3_g08010 [Leptospira kobayashii]